MLLFLFIMFLIYVICVNIINANLNYTDFKKYLYGKYYIEKIWRIMTPADFKKISEKVEVEMYK